MLNFKFRAPSISLIQVWYFVKFPLIRSINQDAADRANIKLSCQFYKKKKPLLLIVNFLYKIWRLIERGVINAFWMGKWTDKVTCTRRFRPKTWINIFFPIFTKITKLCFPKIFNNLPMFRLCLDEIMFIIYLTSGH